MMTAFTYTGAIQTFQVPVTGEYAVNAHGAEGGGVSNSATLSGDVQLTAGTKVSVVVGGQGQLNGNNGNGVVYTSGGGGSFVYVSGASQPLFVAGGGGGGGGSAQTTTGGAAGSGSGPGAGGSNGAGGQGGQVYVSGSNGGVAGGGGGGWVSNGGDPKNAKGGGGGGAPSSFAGGSDYGGDTGVKGGYGGGGWGGTYGGGGGGGYSGGGGGGGNSGADGGGGGGSYVTSSASSVFAKADSTGGTNGSVSIIGLLTAATQSASVAFETPKPITLTAVDAAKPGAALTFSVATSPAFGTLTILNPATGAVSYDPGTYIGPDRFTYTVSDGTNTATGTVNITVAPPTTVPWMSTLPDTEQLTNVSLPGTYESAAGPDLANALLGTGSVKFLNSPSLTNTATTNAALVAHVAADTAAIAALAAGGNNAAANAAAAAANAAALTADAAAGITMQSTGAGLAIGLASDITGLASAIATAVQAAKAAVPGPADSTAGGAGATATTDDTAADAALTAAGTDDSTAGALDATAGTDDGTAGGADASASIADAAAGATDGTAGGADAGAATADVAAAAQGAIDPVADVAAAVLDGIATGTDATAATADSTAVALNGTADTADGTATPADTAAVAADGTAAGADGAADAAVAPTTAANTTASSNYGSAGGTHTAAAAADSASAVAFVAGATADGYTADQFKQYAQGLFTPDTNGNNPNNLADQNAIYALAIAEATAHTGAATAESAAAVADALAAGLNGTASTLDAAVADAVASATAAEKTATADNDAAAIADATAATADAAAGTADTAALTANAAAATADGTADGLDVGAGAADGLAAGADTASAAADSTAIALDATAVATIEIPIVDVITAAAAGIADGVAAGLDVTATAADSAAAVTDGLATAADSAAAPLDAGVTAADAAAATADATATTDDTAATTADATAATADLAAHRALFSLLTAIKAADLANEAAESADAAAGKANNAALVAATASIAADVSFSGKVQALQTVQVQETTQTLAIGDQLAAGVRALDLRGALVDDTINLNVGSDYVGDNLQDALDDVTSFLSANPTETVVISLGDETAPIGSTNSFNADLNALLGRSDSAVTGTTYNAFVYTSSDATVTPTVGQARGKIVFVPDSDGTESLPTDTANGQQIGWTPTQAVGDSTNIVKADLGTPATLYTSDLTPGGTSNNPVADGDNQDAVAQTYFAQAHVVRTTGIVGIDDPSITLINEIIAENNTPIIVTSDSDDPTVAGTLRDAILQANAQPGFDTIEFAPALTGSTGNVIDLQDNLPPVTDDLDLIGNGSVSLQLNGFAGPAAAGATHTVTESDFPTSADQTTLTTETDNPGLYVRILNLNTGGAASASALTINPVNLTYGTPLANAQLSGTATAVVNGSPVTIAGTFTYTTAAGTVLKAGTGQAENVTFTPAANGNGYTAQTGTVTVNVAQATPTVTVTAVSLTYGTALANGQLTGTATYVVNGAAVAVPGTFAYASAAGTVLNASGKGQAEAVTFTPTDATDYRPVATTVTVNVAQATPTVTVNPVNLTPGDTLNNAQLSGTATAVVNGATVSVTGTFSYTTAAGTVIGTGTGQTESVTFTPSDTTDFNAVTTTTVVNAVQGSPVSPAVTVNPVSIVYGRPLANPQLSGTATYAVGGTAVAVPGTFAFTTAAGTVLSAGSGQTEAVTFTPTDTTDYAAVATTVTVNVAAATPTIANVNPVALTFGTPLSNGQLTGIVTAAVNGQTVNVPGTFAYTTAAGTVLGAGQGQFEAVTFTPTDSTDFTTATAFVTVTVAKATPTVTAVTPVNITYGTALANGQLAGTAVATINGVPKPVPGTFTYATAGTVPNAGNGQTAAVVFTPTDATDFTTATSTVTVNVTPATPTVTVTDAGGVANGSPYPATGTVTGVNGVNLGTPTFTYYLATDTTLSNPLSAAPSLPGRYTAVGTHAASGNYATAVGMAGFTITATAIPAVNATITTAAQPATATVGATIADRATVTGSLPSGRVTFRLYNNTTAFGLPLFTDVEPVVAGTATSKGYTTTAAAIGTDYWVGIYSGDANNNPATSGDTADPVTVGGSLVVNSAGDGAAATGNTLRDAVAYADTLGAGTHPITFDPAVFASAQTITLDATLGALPLTDAAGTTTITGPSSGVTVTGGGKTGLFTVNAGVTATLSGLTLTGGAAAQGGAINDKGTLTVDHSLLVGNSASNLGGAIDVTGSLTAVDDTFASNTAVLSGGAIEDAGSVTVLDSTLAGNAATTATTGSGGGIDNGGGGYTLKVGDTILSGNSAAVGADVSNAVTSLGNNLVSRSDGSTGWVASDLTGTAAKPLSAGLAALGNNGGPTQTFALQAGSPAIGAGAPLAGVTTDQRGVARPAANPDIGAYQTQAPTLTTVTGLTITRGGFVYNARTKAYTQTLTIQNTTAAALSGPLSLVFGSASGATLTSATGKTQVAHGSAAAGSSYVTLPATTLATNGTETVTLTFAGTSSPIYTLLALLGSGTL